jgi:hypothetical protein
VIIKNETSLKAKIRNIARAKKISPQVVLQNFFMERFLVRLSQFKTAINAICAMPVDDRLSFRFTGIMPIRDDDEYGGFRVALNVVYGIINAPLSVDITSGDIIIPQPVKRVFIPLFDDTEQFELWTYSTETILAEKVETILRRGEYNTRMRDFYDVYLILKTQDFDMNDFRKAFAATANHRGTTEQINPVLEILSIISGSQELRRYWEKYRREYNYAKDIVFEDTIKTVQELLFRGG